jgi:alpha-galactosidase
MPLSLCIIGAGSRFSFGIAADLIREPHFAGSTLALVDPDERALDTSTRIVNRMVAQSKADLTIVSSADRRDVLAGCDYVLNSIAVGEPFARERDVAIGEQHGIYQPTSQTVGPAGYFRGLRVLPHAVGIAEDVAELCPDATIIDLANPLAAVCRSMIRSSGRPVIGLCEQWAVTQKFFARVLEVSEEELLLNSVGTNHLTWAIGLEYKGREILGEVVAALHEPENKSFLDEVPVSAQTYRAFGAWPTGTEEHIAEFFNYFLSEETNGGADLGMRIRHVSEEQWDERWKERESWANGDASIDHLLGPSGENAVEIIAALEGFHPPITEMVNIPNQGLIDDLPDEAIVELPARIGPSGVQGLKVGPLPPAVRETLRSRITQQELQIDAALSGNRDLALRGLLFDAQITSLKVADEIMDASIEANAEFLPRFKGKGA